MDKFEEALSRRSTIRSRAQTVVEEKDKESDKDDLIRYNSSENAS